MHVRTPNQPAIVLKSMKIPVRGERLKEIPGESTKKVEGAHIIMNAHAFQCYGRVLSHHCSSLKFRQRALRMRSCTSTRMGARAHKDAA